MIRFGYKPVYNHVVAYKTVHICHLGIRLSGNPLPKKLPFMRVWVQSLRSSKYTCV